MRRSVLHASSPSCLVSCTGCCSNAFPSRLDRESRESRRQDGGSRGGVSLEAGPRGGRGMRGGGSARWGTSKRDGVEQRVNLQLCATGRGRIGYDGFDDMRAVTLHRYVATKKDKRATQTHLSSRQTHSGPFHSAMASGLASHAAPWTGADARRRRPRSAAAGRRSRSRRRRGLLSSAPGPASLRPSQGARHEGSGGRRKRVVNRAADEAIRASRACASHARAWARRGCALCVARRRPVLYDAGTGRDISTLWRSRLAEPAREGASSSFPSCHRGPAGKCRSPGTRTRYLRL